MAGFGVDDCTAQGRQRLMRESSLEQREELPLLVPDVRAEQRPKPVRGIQQRVVLQRRGAVPDLRMLVAHTPGRSGPLGVVRRQGRQHHALLDHEVMLALAIPEVEEVLDGLRERHSRSAPEA